MHPLAIRMWRKGEGGYGDTSPSNNFRLLRSHWMWKSPARASWSIPRLLLRNALRDAHDQCDFRLPCCRCLEKEGSQVKEMHFLQRSPSIIQTAIDQARTLQNSTDKLFLLICPACGEGSKFTFPNTTVSFIVVINNPWFG